MRDKMYRCSKTPISEWKHGEKHSLKVDQLTVGELLGDEWEDLIPANMLDNLYYHLLDSKAIRKKLREGK